MPSDSQLSLKGRWLTAASCSPQLLSFAAYVAELPACEHYPVLLGCLCRIDHS